MIYCLDFDGTIIPPIHYKNDKQFFRDPLRAKTFLSKEEILFYNNHETNIITDRPEDGLLVVDAYCKKIDLIRAHVYSSYGPHFYQPSSRKKIVLKKVAIMLLLTADSHYRPEDSKKYGDKGLCQYVDKDLFMMADINNLYKKLLKMKIEPFKRDKK